MFGTSDKPGRNGLASEKLQNKRKESQHDGELERDWAVTSVFAAVAFFPVDGILVEAPVTNAGHTDIGNRPASADDLSPPAVPWLKQQKWNVK
jgi:hypothetical protein